MTDTITAEQVHKTASEVIDEKTRYDPDGQLMESPDTEEVVEAVAERLECEYEMVTLRETKGGNAGPYNDYTIVGTIPAGMFRTDDGSRIVVTNGFSSDLDDDGRYVID